MPSGPVNVEVEVEPVRCGKCKHVFNGFALHTLNGTSRLLVGDHLIDTIKMVCRQCHHVFNYHKDDRMLARENEKLAEILGILYGQKNVEEASPK